ncbi:MAG: hypothetical protein KAI61_04680, partial [Alphaproteobacteria bacterium]|nr:hypothetical protein [Alphaproteobacteria bacterium]
MFDTIVQDEDQKCEVPRVFNNGNSELEYTSALALETAELYNKVKRVITPSEWKVHAPYISEINRLKKEKGA